MASSDIPPNLQLRPATPEDRFVIRRWLAEPEVQQWWGSAAAAEARITLAMASPAALPRVIEYDGAAVGFAHAVEVGLWAEPQPAELPAGAWEIDLFIAAAAHRGQSLAPAVLALLTEEVFATTLALACSAIVSIRNETTVRSYERAGFTWLRIWQHPLLGPSWVMLKERPRQTR